MVRIDQPLSQRDVDFGQERAPLAEVHSGHVLAIRIATVLVHSWRAYDNLEPCAGATETRRMWDAAEVGSACAKIVGKHNAVAM